METLFGELWWFEHLADLITLAMAACLVLMGVMLCKWPPPVTWLRWVTVFFAFTASGVTFWHVAISRIPPHPRVFVAFFIVSLTFTVLKYQATARGHAMGEHRRYDD